MKATRCILALMATLALAAAAPAPEPAPAAAPAPAPADDSRPEIIEIIAPADNAQETLSTLNLGAPGSELSERNKRTIGILRQLFPTLTQIIEQKVQQITSFVLQTFGPTLLRAFLGNRNGGGNTGGGSGTVQLDDDDDDDDDDEPLSSSTSTTTEASFGKEAYISSSNEAAVEQDADIDSSNDSAVKKEADIASSNEAAVVKDADIAFTNEAAVEKDADIASTNETAVEKEADIATSNEVAVASQDDEEDEDERRRRKRALFFLPNAIADENQLLSGAESQQAEVRVAFGDGAAAADQAVAASEDQQAAAAQNSASIDEITLEDTDDSEADRNKRFLSFGGNSGASGGGSGNFLFDIVRQAPGAMARAAGSAFRLFAGTDSLNVGLTASHSASLDPADTQLVAGSSSGSSGGEGGAEGEDGAAKGDNLTEGVPGPITRLFIIANRGIANLVQDLILRIAQTSERIVNFKARLITSII